MPTPTVPPSKRPNPRHPFPSFRDEFAPRGWSIFATNTRCGSLMVWGVLCANLPPTCVRTHGFPEYLRSTPETFRDRLRPIADAIDAHARRCGACARALEVVVWRSRSQEPTKGQ